MAVRIPFICTYIFCNLLEGSLQCVTHCFRLILSVLEYFDKCMFPFQLPTNGCFHTYNFLSSQEGTKCQRSHLANNESYRNRSFSFNPNTGYSTPSMKVRWAMQLKLQIMFYCYTNPTDNQDNKGPINFL